MTRSWMVEIVVALTRGASTTPWWYQDRAIPFQAHHAGFHFLLIEVVKVEVSLRLDNPPVRILGIKKWHVQLAVPPASFPLVHHHPNPSHLHFHLFLRASLWSMGTPPRRRFPYQVRVHYEHGTNSYLKRIREGRYVGLNWARLMWTQVRARDVFERKNMYPVKFN